ncbi:MAG: hypothetical protein DRP56_02380 [Planctomycetota bacterium]|nr:MAG: hypothetical protein DRP56_02380 [Planctomycetota bacterium]
MSNRKLSVLGIIAVVMVGWAILQNWVSQNISTADFSSSALIEGLQIEAVAGITITSERGEKTTTLSRKDGGFVVADKDNYPADVAAVNALFNGCLDIRTQEKITDSPDNHADLEVTPQTARSVVSFTDTDGGEIVALVLSPSNETGESFARLLSETAVYSIQYSPQIKTAPMDFVDAQLFQVPQDQLSSVAVRTPEGSYILTASADGADIKLQNMPAGKQYKETVYKSVFGALRSLRFDNVVHAGNVLQEFQFDFLYTCKLKDKTVYKLMLAKKGEKTYAKVLADYLDKSPVEKTVGQVESEEELKAKEAKLLVIDAVNQFNKKHSGWVYQIPAANAENLMMSLSGLLEDSPESVSGTDPNAAQ